MSILFVFGVLEVQLSGTVVTLIPAFTQHEQLRGSNPHPGSGESISLATNRSVFESCGV